MKLSNEPLIEGQPVKFVLTGFPEEAAVKLSVERFYSRAVQASRDFLIFNTFEEQIFSGSVDEQGRIHKFEATPHSSKTYSATTKPE